FLAPIRIISDTSEIYSERGWFDLDDKKGDFIGNAQYKEGTTTAKADTINYDGVQDLVTLKSDTLLSEYISEKDTAYAKVIAYDKQNEIFKLIKDAWYRGEKNEVKGDKVFYNKKTEKFNVSGRSQVSDPPTIIVADTLDYDKAIKYGKADGHVIWRDTAAKTAIIADHVLYQGESNFMVATNDTGRPMFTTEIDGDTLFLKADTLKSFRTIAERWMVPDKNAARRAAKEQQDESKAPKGEKPMLTDLTIPKDTAEFVTLLDSTLFSSDTSLTISRGDSIFTGIIDTIDYFVGYPNVRMYKSDMQAVCDSLVFNQKDSIFTLHRLPFVWSDSSQISGDTIDILLASKSIDRMLVRSGATILSTEDLLFFDQIEGRFVEAYFRDSKIYRMDVNGNANIVYYMKDKEKAYIGINTTEASSMSFLLDDNKITDIRNFVEPKSKIIPMKKADHGALKVKGFLWNADHRPANQYDLDINK
ncbi:MAG: LptA/OstA family protein, partial [Saprospiraceae bacterium]